MTTGQKDQLDHARHQMLLGFLIGFALWQVAVIFGHVLGTNSLRLQRGVLVVGLLGWLYWIVQLLRMVRLRRILKGQPEVAAVLNDEYVREKRQRALAFAFWLVLATQAGLVAMNPFERMDAAVGAQITILVAVAGAIGAFLFFDRD